MSVVTSGKMYAQILPVLTPKYVSFYSKRNLASIWINEIMWLIGQKTYVMHPSYSEFHYSAVVLWVHADVLYDLNTHHTVCLSFCLSVDQWGHVYFPFKHTRHMHSWLASRSKFSLKMSTRMDLSSDNSPQMTLHCFSILLCYFENCSISQGKTIS